MPNPSDTTQTLTPEALANQLFDAAIMQYNGDPREGARQVIVFLTEALIYAASSTASDEERARRCLKSLGDTIAAVLHSSPSGSEAREPPWRPRTAGWPGTGDWLAIVRVSRVDDEVIIAIETETCGECGEPVIVVNEHPESGAASCGCTVEGSESCAAIDMRGEIRAMLVAAIARIDASNGALP